MGLLIDYLEEAAAYLMGQRGKLKKLDAEYHRVYDSDLVREMRGVRTEIARKQAEVKEALLVNLEEFRALNKYFPELLGTYMEDEHIGKVITSKAWLLDFRPIPQEQAAAKLEQLKEWRAQLRDARKFLRGWIGKVDSRSFGATYLPLRGYLKGEMDKEEVLHAIDKVDRLLRREGWLVLISDSVINIPLSKFVMKYNSLQYDETKAQLECRHMAGRGTVAESKAAERLREVQKQKEHYARMITQLFLANPEYLASLKKRKTWLSRDKGGAVERFARLVTPHKIKERVWLNDMRKKLGIE